MPCIEAKGSISLPCTRLTLKTKDMKINYWLLLLAGIILVLSGVTLRIGEQTPFSAFLIIAGLITEFISVFFLIRKAILK